MCYGNIVEAMLCTAWTRDVEIMKVVKSNAATSPRRPRSPVVVSLILLASLTLASQLYQQRQRGIQSSRTTQQPVVLPEAVNLTAVAVKDIGHSQLGRQASTEVKPAFRLPRLIHQTVRSKSELTCQQQRVIHSWKVLNPGYKHQLWDDNDIRDFVQQYYPDLVPTPFDDFLSGAERSDLWRVLVLHKLGGVYADMDVQCLKPIDNWNAEHGCDAQVLLGMENYDAEREHPIHVVNWVLAATPGHPLLGSFAAVVSKVTQHQFFEVMKRQSGVTAINTYEAGIIDRTGPAALSRAMYDYFRRIGWNVANVTDVTVDSHQGFVAGGVRVLPVANMAAGWEVAESRRKGTNITCDDVAKRHPDAYVCHMFAGSWRSNWYYKANDAVETC